MQRRSERALRKRKKANVGGTRGSFTHRRGISLWRGKTSMFTDEFYEALGGPEFSGIVLHLGCQDGVETVRLASRGVRVVGVDDSRDAVANARLRALRSRRTARFDVASMTNLPYKDAAFDALFSKFKLERQSIPKVMAEVRRVLKSGGIAFIVMGYRSIDVKRERAVNQGFSKDPLIRQHFDLQVFEDSLDGFNVLAKDFFETFAFKPLPPHKHVDVAYVLQKV